MLLTREEFQKSVFARGQHKCVMCKSPAADAHHIIDRSLFDDGGYHIDNGVSVCPVCHLLAEQTVISCKELRAKAGITHIVLPEHFEDCEEWDHWGNIVLKNGCRLRGEKFFEENVQKALRDGNQLSSFLPYVKYPRTYHLPHSPNLQNDDRKHTNVDYLYEQSLIGTIKLDGENTTLYPDYIHARSLNSKHHESRAWIKALHGSIAHDIPKGYRICGENLYAKHSIHYQHLKNYFYVFSIWNEKNEALSWEETEEYCELLGLHMVPVFYQGTATPAIIDAAFENYQGTSPDSIEGYVLRVPGRIPYHKFRTYTGKFVRANHVQTDEFWMNQPVIPNKVEDGIVYFNHEVKDILRILKKDTIHATSIFIWDGISPDDFQDVIALKYGILSEIKVRSDNLKKLEPLNWCNASDEKILKAYSGLLSTLFCKLDEVPMHINGPFKEIAAWRLNNGK